MAKISNIKAREILDSRGNPTIEVETYLDNNQWGRAAVPSGASTGAHEALELRDKDEKRYLGKGVLKAIENVNTINQSLSGKSFDTYKELDKALIELDGTENKSKFGANAILGISLSFAKALANSEKQPLYKYLNTSGSLKLPVPLMNILNGGAHANNGLDVQEFMIAPVGASTFKEALRMGSEIFQNLKKILDDKGHSTAVGDEGGFAPDLKSNKEALELVAQATEKSGYSLGDDIVLALDVAATELYNNGTYTWDNEKKTAQEITDIYASWCKSFPLKSIEDGLDEDDWEGWKHLTQTLGSGLQLVGDDLFVTNPTRIQKGIEEKAANALLVKVNQIGSLSETYQAIELCQKNNYKTVMSHRSGETEDSTISDLSVAFGCQQIKTGSLCRGERTAKYNQLLRIEEQLGSNANYWGIEGL